MRDWFTTAVFGGSFVVTVVAVLWAFGLVDSRVLTLVGMAYVALFLGGAF